MYDLYRGCTVDRDRHLELHEEQVRNAKKLFRNDIIIMVCLVVNMLLWLCLIILIPAFV